MIVGAGIIGLATAWELAAAGACVTVIDRGGEPGRESSWAGGGILCALLPWDYPQAVTALVDFSTALYPAWMSELHALSAIQTEYRQTGVLVLPPFDERSARTWISEHHASASIISASDAGEALYGAERALWIRDAAQVRNPRLIKALVEALARRGVEIASGTEVRDFEVSGDVLTRVTTEHTHWAPGNVIVAAGAWSARLLRHVGPALDVFPVRGQMLLYKTAPGTLETILLQNNRYVIPRSDGHILVGSTREQVGFDSRTTQTGRRELETAAAELFPPLADLSPIAHWAGLRPGSPDNIPTVARHPQLRNLYVNAGHYRYGLTMAPGCARLLANLLLGRDQPIDVSLYDWPAENHPR